MGLERGKFLKLSGGGVVSENEDDLRTRIVKCFFQFRWWNSNFWRGLARHFEGYLVSIVVLLGSGILYTVSRSSVRQSHHLAQTGSRRLAEVFPQYDHLP